MDVAGFANRVDDYGAGRIDFADEGRAFVGDEFALDHVPAVAFAGAGKAAIQRYGAESLGRFAGWFWQEQVALDVDTLDDLADFYVAR
jgi:hypothetical protein